MSRDHRFLEQKTPEALELIQKLKKDAEKIKKCDQDDSIVRLCKFYIDLHKKLLESCQSEYALPCVFGNFVLKERIYEHNGEVNVQRIKKALDYLKYDHWPELYE